MSRYKTYSGYKDSEVEWLGEIPVHWKISRIKYSTYLKGRVGWKGLTSEEYLNEGYAYLITGTDFQNKYICWENCHHISQDRYEDDPYIQLKNDDLLITKDGTIGKLALIIGLNKPACLNSGIFLIRPLTNYITPFMYWFLSSNSFKVFCDLTTVGSTILHLYQNVFENFKYSFSNIEDQQKIADFLDYETSKIDQLINKQKALIELLKEKRQALISQAVTKGLNPKAKMKDSGIEWLGEVPKHWIISKAKYVSDIFIPQRNKPELNDSNEGVPWITIEDVKKGTIINGKYFVSDEVRTMASSKILKKESVIASCVGDFGIVAINKVDVIINQQLQAFIPYAINNEYLKYSIENSKCYFEAIGTAATLIYVNQQGFENLPILIPPLAEQISIINFLSKGLDKIDVILDKTKQSIGLLQERRTALISAAVTGKIDVRDWQSPNAIDTMTNITPN